MARDFDDINPRTGQEKAPRINEQVDVFTWPKKPQYVDFRFVGGVRSFGMHWIKIISSKQKKEVSILKACLAYDEKTDTRDSTKKCPYCKLPNARFTVDYYVNAISRDLQDDEPEKNRITPAEQKSGFKDPDSKSWTPVKAVRLTSGCASDVKGLKDLNKVKDKKTGKIVTYSVLDPKMGCDVSIKFDPEAPGTKKYAIQKGERTPLEDYEQDYLLQNLDEIEFPVETLEVAKAEAAKFLKQAPEGMKKGADDEDEDYDDDDAPKKGKGKSSAKSKKNDDFDEDDDDDSDDFDSDDDDEEEEDEKPARGKGKSKASSKSKKKDEDDEEDDDDFGSDDDSDDEDDEEDEKPTRGKSKSSAKSKKKDEDEDDDDDFGGFDDDDDDDEEEEDEKPARGRGKAASKSKSKGKSKRSSDDDEDDDDDFGGFDEDDEEDEKPTRSKSKSSAKAAPKSKGKSKKSYDDDEDDIPF